MTRRLVAAAVVLWLAALLLTVVVVRVGVPPVDQWLADALHSFAVENLWLAWLARVFAVLGSAYVLFPLTFLVVVGLWRRHRWFAMWVAACGLGGIVISQTMKRLIDRQRPVWDNPLHELSSPSFPSGHSMAGIYGYVVFGILALVLLQQRWPGIVLIAIGVLMGPSRVAFGVHWPSDVLAGWLYACAWVCTVTAVMWWRLGPPPLDDRADVRAEHSGQR